jgi:hypothetical protein
MTERRGWVVNNPALYSEQISDALADFFCDIYQSLQVKYRDSALN